MIDAVLAAAAAGWPVFPVQVTETGHKQPLIKWKDGAAVGVESARTLFARFPGVVAFGGKTGGDLRRVVIDIDVRDGAGGKAWYLANEARLPLTYAVRTRSGGVHLHFTVPEGVEIRNSASRLAPGVDVRGWGGYVLLPGSAGYSVARALDVADMPEWLLADLEGLKAKAIERSAAPLEAGAVPALEMAELVGDGTPWGLGVLRKACQAIVGAEDGTKHETLNREAWGVGGLVAGSEIKAEVAEAALLEAVDAIAPWCKDAEAARRTALAALAEGMAKPRDAAREKADRAARDFAGVDAPVVDPLLTAQAKALMGDALEDDEKDRLKEAVLAEWVWVDEVKRFGWLGQGRMSDMEQFAMRYWWWGDPMSRSKSAAGFFMRDPRHKMVDGITYLPGGVEIVDEPGIGRCWNRWRPSTLVPAAGDVTPWLAQVERMIPDAGQRNAMLDWMAFLLQKQALKCNWAPLLVSVPGMGKDFLMRAAVLALGEHNVSVIGVHDVESGFNDWSSCARLVMFNEVHSASRVAMVERMKPHITAPPTSLLRNRKHTPQWMQPNRHCMLFWSNRLDAVHIEEGDRRYFVLHVVGEKQPPSYWRPLWHWMDEGGGAAAVAAWLLARDISAFDHGGEAPWTAAKSEMALHTASDMVTEIKDAVEGGEWPDIVSPQDLAARMNAGRQGLAVTARAIGNGLRSIGARYLAGGHPVRLLEAITGGGTRARLMSTRNHDFYTGMNPATLARKYRDGWAEINSRDFSGLVNRRPTGTEGPES